MELLESTTNPFGGVIITPGALPEAPEAFHRQLAPSLDEWKAKGLKAVWLELPVVRADLVPVAIGAGFSYHHTGDGYVMLTRPLVSDATIPPYASHYIGAGGVVLSPRNELLVVRERVGRQGRPSSYKLPGGAVHVGEHLVEGVVREVLEETGVQTRFESLACFRNMHGYRHGKSDIYFVCRLKPVSRRIAMQVEEIEECLWMPLDQYLEADNASDFNKTVVRAALNSPGLVPSRVDGYRDPATYEVFLPEGATE